MSMVPAATVLRSGGANRPARWLAAETQVGGQGRIVEQEAIGDVVAQEVQVLAGGGTTHDGGQGEDAVRGGLAAVPVRKNSLTPRSVARSDEMRVNMPLVPRVRAVAVS